MNKKEYISATNTTSTTGSNEQDRAAAVTVRYSLGSNEESGCAAFYGELGIGLSGIVSRVAFWIADAS